MRKTLTLTACCLAIVGSLATGITAYAQDTAAPAASADQATPKPSMSPAGPDQRPEHRADRGPNRGPDRGPAPGGPRGHGPRHHGDRNAPPPPPSPAAHFVFQNGPMRIDIKCADTDSSEACGAVAEKLIDKMAAFKPMPGKGRPGPDAPGKPGEAAKPGPRQ